jgi:hypothetical protein
VRQAPATNAPYGGHDLDLGASGALDAPGRRRVERLVEPGAQRIVLELLVELE